MSEWIYTLSMLVTNGTIWLKGDSLHYEGDLSPSLKEELSEHREKIELWFKLDLLAKRSGWFRLEWGQVYEMQVSTTSYVYLLKEAKGWVVWRGTWSPVKGKMSSIPLKEKWVAKGLTFDEALSKGNNYVKWWRR